MTQVSDSKGSGFIDEWGFCGEECPMEEKSTLGKTLIICITFLTVILYFNECLC